MAGTHQLHLANADMIPGVSISYQTALSTSARRLPAHPASALTIHPIIDTKFCNQITCPALIRIYRIQYGSVRFSVSYIYKNGNNQERVYPVVK